MKVKILVIILSLTLPGCSSTHLVTPAGQGETMSFEGVNRRVKSHEVTVTSDGDQTTTAKMFYLDGDSASWTEVSSGRLVKVPVTKIQQLVVVPTTFVEGMAFVGCGIVLGGLIGWQIGSGWTYTLGEGTPGQRGMAIGAVTGAVIMTLFVITEGGDPVFVFPHDSLSSIIQSEEE